jgi:hypothetical protein
MLPVDFRELKVVPENNLGLREVVQILHYYEIDFIDMMEFQ